MFRVKLTIDPELRNKYENQVKTGIRGVGYVRSGSDHRLARQARR